MLVESPSPKKPDRGSQAQDPSPWYVTLGKVKSEKSQTPYVFRTSTHTLKLMNLPFSVFVSGGRFADPIPIIVKVHSEVLADEVLAYGDAIRMIAAASLVVDRVRLVFTLPVGGEILKNYPDPYLKHGQDARAATNNFLMAIWKKVPDFRRAIAVMLSSGESEKDNDPDLVDLLQDYKRAHGDVDGASQFPTSSPVSYTQTSSQGPMTPHTPRRNGPSQEPTTPRAYAPSQVPRTPLARASSQGPHTPIAHASSQDLPRSLSPIASAPDSSPSSSPILSLLTERTFDVALADTNLSGDVVYQHTRNLRGIKGTHSYPCVNTQSVVSCGPQLDMFLQALGYDLKSKVTVVYACATSPGMENFVREMIKKGVPVLEAKYMWILYTASLPDGLWADIHIM
ncbi:hypothetical protein TRAPUB_11680 [Trametes pubescens]|uniref:Uncharacterized protein n=1 Tax=Trametes pubescens TaxID=154538 RepID=A0A1M2VW05_TRAPU|nr:hypothetical protein TRAPUB_11680 [Trametes pubescens]